MAEESDYDNHFLLDLAKKGGGDVSQKASRLQKIALEIFGECLGRHASQNAPQTFIHSIQYLKPSLF